MAGTAKNSGSFAKGNPGKPKGATSHVTRELKAMILGALDNAGGIDYLTERANDPKTASAFLTLVGKVLPLAVTGADGGALKHSVTINVRGVEPNA